MKIAILGYGTVGRGVDQIIAEHVDGVEVTRILELPDRLSDPRMTSSFDEILADEKIELVVECMGGVEPARTYIMAALQSGRHVVTSNKAVVAAHFAEFAERPSPRARASSWRRPSEAACRGSRASRRSGGSTRSRPSRAS